MERFIFEKREATASEKATCSVFDMEESGIFRPQFRGEEEAAQRLHSVDDKVRYIPCVFVTNKSGYVPVRFRNSEKYFVV